MTYMPSTNLQLAVDGHLHVYPAHRLDRLATACLSGLSEIAGPGRDVQPTALLTESAGHTFFRRARHGDVAADGCTVGYGPDADTLWLKHPDFSHSLLLFAGRQIVTAERLEVLALTRDVAVSDGLPLLETLCRVRDAGAVPCLAWSPGKWWGGRGHLVRELLADETRYLAIGDSALRPRFWREPRLMRVAAARGWPVLAGSDPLPFPGDERRAGRYGFRMALEGYDPQQPSAALRAALARGNGVIQRAGRRCGVCEWWCGRFRHRRYRQHGAKVS